MNPGLPRSGKWERKPSTALGVMRLGSDGEVGVAELISRPSDVSMSPKTCLRPARTMCAVLLTSRVGQRARPRCCRLRCRHPASSVDTSSRGKDTP